MLVLESLELQIAPHHGPEEVNSCTMDPSFVQDMVAPANVTCVKGVLSVV